MFSVRNVALRRTQIYAHLPSRVNRSQTAPCWAASRIRATAVKIMCAMVQSLLLSSQVRVHSLFMITLSVVSFLEYNSHPVLVQLSAQILQNFGVATRKRVEYHSFCPQLRFVPKWNNAKPEPPNPKDWTLTPKTKTPRSLFRKSGTQEQSPKICRRKDSGPFLVVSQRSECYAICWLT